MYQLDNIIQDMPEEFTITGKVKLKYQVTAHIMRNTLLHARVIQPTSIRKLP